MDDHVLLVVDFDNLCRLCLNPNGSLSDIFKKTETFSLHEQIARVTGIMPTDGDGLPQAICHKCRYIVEVAYELQETVKTSTKLLNDVILVNNSEEKAKNFDENNIEKLEDFKDLYHTEHLDNQHKSNKKPQPHRKVAPKKLTCQICLHAFPSEDQVHLHACSHYTDSALTPYLDLEKPYNCEKCEENGLSRTELVRHHREHLGVNPYQCKEDGCKFVGKDLAALRHHTSVHGPREHTCSSCGASFTRRWSLAAHVARLHRPAEAPCPQCGVRCRNDLALKAHIKTHGRPRRFQCTYPGCGRAYLARAHLTAHESSHAAAREHRCRQCSAAYTSASLLNRHMKQHGRARLWQCCGARYAEYGEYYAHRRDAHGDARAHRCLACGYSYKTKVQLDKHLERCERAARLRAAASNEESPKSVETQGASAQTDLQDLSSEGLLFIQTGP